ILACSLASMGRIDKGQAHRERAERIYQGLSHAPGLIELRRCWNQAVGRVAIADFSSASNSAETPAKAVTPGGIAQSIASLLLLADRPELLARGVLDLLDATEAVEQATASICSGESTHEVLATIGRADNSHNDFLKLPRRLTIGSVYERR